MVVSSAGGELRDRLPPNLNTTFFSHSPRSRRASPVGSPTASPTVAALLAKEASAGPKETREAGAFLRFVIRRYDTLPDVSVYVHADVFVHNPVWLRWLYCLRPDVDMASLSPLIVISYPANQGNFLDTMRAASGLSTPREPRGFPICCFLAVFSRQAIRRFPLAAYQQAERLLLSNKMSAFDLELQGHFLFPPDPHEHQSARDVCHAFQCEQPACSTQYIRHAVHKGPLVQGHPKKTVSAELLGWEDSVCGVQDLTQPEWRTVSGVREQLHLPCVRPARDDVSLCKASSIHGGGFASVLPGYSAYIRRGCSHGDERCAKNATYASHGTTAKTAARTADCAIIRCWLDCCASCASRSWCVAWEWSVASGACSLSDMVPGRAPFPSYDRVVGMPMPALGGPARSFRFPD